MQNAYEVLPEPPVSFSMPAGRVRRCPSFSFSGTSWGKATKPTVTFREVISTLAIKSCSGEERTLHTVRHVVDRPSRTGSNHSKSWASQGTYYIQCDKAGHQPITSCPVPPSLPPPWWQWQGTAWRGGGWAVNTIGHRKV